MREAGQGAEGGVSVTVNGPQVRGQGFGLMPGGRMGPFLLSYFRWKLGWDQEPSQNLQCLDGLGECLQSLFAPLIKHVLCPASQPWACPL
jgi:hypothetical protein